MRLPVPLGAILALIGLLCLAGAGQAQDVAPFLKIDAVACAQLDDKNLQVGPPDAEIVAACADLRRSAVLGQRFSGGAAAWVVALLGVVLVYVVLGAPLRPVAGLLGRPTGNSKPTLVMEAALALLLRAGVAWLALAILTLHYATAGGCVLILVALMLSLRVSRSTPGEIAPPASTSTSSVVLADLINDLAASSAGILGLALLARRDPWWLAVVLLFAAVASVPRIIAARRRARRDTTVRLAATIALGAVFGAVAIADPDLADTVGDTLAPTLVGAIVFAIAVLAAGWIRRANPRSTPAAS